MVDDVSNRRGVTSRFLRWRFGNEKAEKQIERKRREEKKERRKERFEFGGGRCSSVWLLLYNRKLEITK